MCQSTQPDRLVDEIEMTPTNRRIISVLMSLLMVMSGPVLAISKISVGQEDTAMKGCGSTMMKQAGSNDSSSGKAGDCVPTPDMTCPSASGLSKCGASFALFLAASNGLLNTGSQPVLNAPAALYQEPFLASITPPPLHHS